MKLFPALIILVATCASLTPLVSLAIVVPTQTVPAKPATTSTAKVFHCYWMDSSTGKNAWLQLNDFNKASCYAADSCNGGLHESNSGCYKWANSADAKPEPWNNGK